jgi:hypothetical protein
VTDSALVGNDLAHLVGAGQRVQTPVDADTLAELTHRNGAVTRLDRDTEVVVHKADDDRPRVLVALGPGRTWHHTGPFDDPALYEARTPGATITGRGAVFVVTCDRTGATSVRVVDGTVVVRGTASGSVVASDGLTVEVTPGGLAGPSSPMAAPPDLAAWIAINRLVDGDDVADHADLADGAIDPDGNRAEAEATHPPTVEQEAERNNRPMPSWVAWTAGISAAAGFIALLALTFVTAREGDRAAARTEADTALLRVGPEGRYVALSAAQPPAVAALPAGAFAIIRAAQDRRVAPETSTDTTSSTSPSTTTTTIDLTRVRSAAPAPSVVFTPVPTAAATGTACTQKSGVITYSGSLTNTGTTASSFMVSAAFTTRTGVPFATGSAKVGPVDPGQTTSWSMNVPSGTDLRGTGASCDVSEVRPA